MKSKKRMLEVTSSVKCYYIAWFFPHPYSFQFSSVPIEQKRASVKNWFVKRTVTIELPKSIAKNKEQTDGGVWGRAVTVLRSDIRCAHARCTSSRRICIGLSTSGPASQDLSFIKMRKLRSCGIMDNRMRCKQWGCGANRLTDWIINLHE